jgi:ribosome-associated protein
MTEDLVVTDRLTIPSSDLRYQTSRSGGSGGQHVNTADTRIQLFFNLRGCSVIRPDVRRRLQASHPSSLTSEGEMLLASGRNRSRLRNIQDVRERLAQWIRDELVPPKKRRPTTPSRRAKARRVDNKKQRSKTKKTRGRVKGDGWG